MKASNPATANAPILARAYHLMFARFGHQNWWPGDTDFEMCLGAILTQNTSWANVEKAIKNLKSAHALNPEALDAIEVPELASLLRPAGYFNLKSRRVKAFVKVLVTEFDGRISQLLRGSTSHVRGRLLAINGIGPETADSMLLYAGRHRRFVIDAYTKRIFSRHGWCSSDADYAALQHLCETTLRTSAGRRLDYWRDYHAQLVRVGKEFCRKQKPRCHDCPLCPLLPDSSPSRQGL